MIFNPSEKGTLSAGIGQRYVPGVVHGNISFFTKVFHGNTNAWLGEIHLICNIYGTNLSSAFLQHKNCF